MDILLNPSRLDTTSGGLPTYGEESLKKVTELYGRYQQIGDNTFPNLIDPDRTKNDFLQFKHFLKSLSNKPYAQVVSSLCMQSLFPDIATLAQILSVSPVTSVSCERAFSAQNLVKTKHRASLSEAVLDKLMRVRLEGPEIQNFDSKQAAVHFFAAKQRNK